MSARSRGERSRRELEAARILAEGGFFPQAASRAYYGAFYAAEAALAALGETRSKHSGVLSAFGRLVVRDGGFDPERGRLLRSLFVLRNEADYAAAEVAGEDAREAIRDAERFVDAVERWREERLG